MSFRWSQIAYCRFNLNLGMTEASLAATRGQQGLKLGQRVQISTRTVATSWQFLIRRSRIRCVAYRQSLESIRQRKILRFISVTIWKDLANYSNFLFYPATYISPSLPSSSPQGFKLPPVYCSSCYHQFIREESTPINSQNRMVNTSFSFSISLGTFLLMNVQRKAMRWSAACSFLLNLIQASSAQINDIFWSSSPVVWSFLQVATPSLTAVIIVFKADGSFCLILMPHFWTTIQSNQMVLASSCLTSHATKDSKNSPVILPQLQRRLMIVVQFFIRQKRLLYPNYNTSPSSSPSVHRERNLTVRPCNRGAMSLFPNALCSPAARATLVASRWKSGFSTIRLNLVKSSAKRGIARDRGCRQMVETNQRKVRRMLPSESLLKKPVIERRTYRCQADWGYQPFFRKGLRYVDACCCCCVGYYWIGCYQSYCSDGNYYSSGYYQFCSSPSYYYAYSSSSYRPSSMSPIYSPISSRLSNILSYSSSNYPSPYSNSPSFYSSPSQSPSYSPSSPIIPSISSYSYYPSSAWFLVGC